MFQKGDIIVCIDDSSQNTNITKGKEYEVLLESKDDRLVCIEMDDMSAAERFLSNRFVLSNKTLIHRLFKPFTENYV